MSVDKIKVGEKEVATPSFSLPKRKVKIIPVIKHTWLAKGHEAAFLYKHAENKFSVPIAMRGGHYINPLTSEEANFLENHPGLSLKTGDLSVHKKENNFWKETIGQIRLGKDERVFDLQDPMDYIIFKVLTLQKDTIAPSAEESKNKLSYKYAIVDLDYEDDKKTTDSNTLVNAMLEYAKIRSDRTSLVDMLFLITKKRISPTSKLEWLQGQVGDYAAKNPTLFLTMVNDTDLHTKILIEKALGYKAITRKGTLYRSAGEDILGVDLPSTVAFLGNPANGDLRMLIEEQVKRAEKG